MGATGAAAALIKAQAVGAAVPAPLLLMLALLRVQLAEQEQPHLFLARRWIMQVVGLAIQDHREPVDPAVLEEEVLEQAQAFLPLTEPQILEAAAVEVTVQAALES